MALKNLKKTSALAKKDSSTERPAGYQRDVGEVLRVLLKLADYGDEISEKCGDSALSFVQDLQERAEKWGDRLKFSDKQYNWLMNIAEKVLR